MALLLKSLQRMQNGLNHLCALRTIYERHSSSFNSLRAFSESNGKNISIDELPDPHALVPDPNDPEGKTKYNTDNVMDEIEDINISDEQFVEGMIVAMEDYCPEVKTITEDDRVDMVDFIKRNKEHRFPSSVLAQAEREQRRKKAM